MTKKLHDNPSMNLYGSIDDLPIWNWSMVNKKGDYTYVKRDRVNDQVTKAERKNLKKHWEKLFAEYIDVFKFSDSFLTILNKKKEISYWQKQYALTDDKSVFTFIEFAKRELEALENEKRAGDFFEHKSILEKFLGFRIDAKMTSVMEFYTYDKMLREKNKEE